MMSNTSDGDRLCGEIEPDATAFFFDVDGTLLGFQDDPSAVVADARLLSILDGLVQKAGGAVALVSGRAVRDLDRIMAPLVLPAAGVHGADLRYADGRRERVAAGALDQVRDEIIRFAADHRGLGVEDKGVALAVHYRLAPQWGEALSVFLAKVVTRKDLVIQHGKMVIEVKPAATDKGTAIDAFMRTEPFAGRRPMFIGDDLTDEHGFRIVNSLGGISIKVGAPHELSAANHRLDDHIMVIDLLERLKE